MKLKEFIPSKEELEKIKPSVEEYYRKSREKLWFPPHIFVAQEKIPIYLTLYAVLKESGCGFYKYVGMRINHEEVMKYYPLLMVKWWYKEKKYRVFMLLEREVKYALYVMLKKLLMYKGYTEEQAEWASADADTFFLPVKFLSPEGGGVFLGSSMQKGACPWCPLFLKKSSCDKRPSDYIKMFPSRRIAEILETLSNSHAWLKLLTAEEKKKIVKHMLRECEIYEKKEWRCDEWGSWDKPPCDMVKDYKRICETLKRKLNT